MEDNKDQVKYANYEGDKPILPLENHSLKKEQQLGYGAVSSVYELNNDKVLKLTSSVVDISSGKVIASGMTPPLVENNLHEDANTSREKAIAKLMDYAKEKKQTYDLLKKYLGAHVTNVDVFAIVDAPLREIYKLRYSFKNDIDVLNIPVSELSVMEVGDKIDKQNELFNTDFDFLKELYSNSSFQERATDFSKKALELFQKERVMLDISGQDRIFVVDKNNSGRYDYAANVDELLSLMNSDDKLPLFNNLAFHNQELQIFDSFPIYEVPLEISDADVAEAIEVVESKDPEKIKEFFNKPLEKFKMISDEFIDDFIKMVRSNDKAEASKLFKYIYPDKNESEIQILIESGIEECDQNYTDDEMRSNFVQMRAGQKFEVLKYAYQLNFLSEKH